MAPTPRGPDFAWRDGAHGDGNPDFFFLPPIFKDPSSDPDYEPAAFNASVRPAVEICLLGDPDVDGNRECTAVFTRFEPSMVTLNATDQLYHVNWDTKNPDVNPASYYRIRVLIGTFELGFVDIDPVSSGSGLKLVTGEYIGLVDGRTLPIKFRIETGALCSVDGTPCSSGTINLNEGGGVTLVSADEEFHFDIAAGTQATFGGQPVTDITFNLQECSGIDVDLPLYGDCLRVTTFFDVAGGSGGTELQLSQPALISLCVFVPGLSEAQEPLITLHQQDGNLIRALPHARPNCDVIGMPTPSRGTIWSWFRDLAARLLTPTPAYARSRAVLFNLGGGGNTDLLGAVCEPTPTARGMLLVECPPAVAPQMSAAAVSEAARTVSDFQFALPAKMTYVNPDDASRTAAPGDALPTAVKVTDWYDAPVERATVTFTVPAIEGPGTIIGTAVSNSDGIAQIMWTIAAGPNSVVASGRGIAAQNNYPGGTVRPFMPDPALPSGEQSAVVLRVGAVPFSATGRVLLSGYEIVSSDAFRLAAGGGFARATANCPAGKVVLGGGAQVVGEGSADFNTRLQESAPGTIGGGATSLWLASVKNEDDGAHDIRVFAICADSPPGYEIVATSTTTLAGSGGFVRETANCPAGKVVMGGGAQVVGEGTGDFNTRLQESGPGTVGGGATSLHLVAMKNEDEGAHAVQTFAVCANPVSGYEVVATSSFSLAAAGGFNRATADCPAGKVVVGGGAQVVGEGTADFNTRLQESVPGTVGGGVTSLWLVSIKNLDALGHTAAIRAVCVDGA